MLTDFHFYAVYAICRLAGKNSRDSKIIAYASQYADDADNGYPIEFEDGSLYDPVLTAHKTLRLGNLTLDVQKKVHMAFHFLPSANPAGVPDPQNRDHLRTRSSCATGLAVIDRALSLKDEAHRLHALGIALHSFADTYAHQGFSGFMGPENETEALFVRRRGSLFRFFNNLWHRAMEFLMPAIGHGELIYVPDTPNAVYSYYEFYSKHEHAYIHNLPRFLEVTRVIYEKLGGSEWEKHELEFTRMFKANGSVEERCARWEADIHAGKLGFVPDDLDKTVHYEPMEWKNRAMFEAEPDSGEYQKLPGFADSDYVHFNTAAREQRELVLALVQQSGVEIKEDFLRHGMYWVLARVSQVFKLKGRKSFTFKAIRRALFRFSIYGTLLIGGEVGFYTLCKICRIVPVDFINRLFAFQWLVDERLNLNAIWQAPVKVLYGQASLWMFFVYACIGLFGIEPFYKHFRHWNWFVRGLSYMFIILGMECITGWILRGITGYDIWYYADHLKIFKYTSWAIAPVWFVTGLLAENLVKFVLKYEEKKKALRERQR